jgi:hypothetical protein
LDIEPEAWMRVFYLVFVISVFLLSGLFRSQPEELKAPGGKDYSENRRIIHYCIIAVVVAVSGWYSVVQLKKDWKTLKEKKNKHKK